MNVEESKEMPWVSIILPAYDNERYIEKSLLSLVNQNYSKKEIIVINDGSTDRTTSILSRLAKENSIVKVLNEEHKGLTMVRNKGLEHSIGDVIFFAEADAIYKNDYLTKAIDCLRNDSSIHCVCVTGGPLKLRSNLVTESIDIENKVQHTRLKDGRIVPFYAWVYKWEVIKVVNGFDTRLSQAEDRDFFHRVMKAGFKVGLVSGINWQHIRDQTVLGFTVKCYRRGISRVPFVLKHRTWRLVFRSVALLWSLVISGLLFPLSPLPLYFTLAIFGFALSYRTLETAKDSYSDAEKKKYFILYPIFLALRHLSFALGYTRGFVGVAVNALKVQVSGSSYSQSETSN